jgi:hypothetical protein
MYIHSRHVNLELLQQKEDVFSHDQSPLTSCSIK